jgi:hypothetical protein
MGKTCAFPRKRRWRRGSESNGAFTGCQPQYPDLLGHFNAGFTRVQALFVTIRHLPDLTHRIHGFYSAIEEIVEAFVEGFSTTMVSGAGPLT